MAACPIFSGSVMQNMVAYSVLLLGNELGQFVLTLEAENFSFLLRFIYHSLFQDLIIIMNDFVCHRLQSIE